MGGDPDPLRTLWTGSTGARIMIAAMLGLEFLMTATSKEARLSSPGVSIRWLMEDAIEEDAGLIPTVIDRDSL